MTEANIRLECLRPAFRWQQPTGEEIREVLRLAGAGGACALIDGGQIIEHTKRLLDLRFQIAEDSGDLLLSDPQRRDAILGRLRNKG